MRPLDSIKYFYHFIKLDKVIKVSFAKPNKQTSLKSMKAIQYSTDACKDSDIHLVDIEKPKAKPGFAVVKVHVAAANSPMDYDEVKTVAGWEIPSPFTLGYDFSGQVDSISEEDDGKPFTTGDEVFAVNWGAYKHDDDGMPIAGAFAEFILIPLSKLSKKPNEVSHEEAAAIALVGHTAHQCLFHCARIEAGSKVLILGGSSAVGSLAIQLAKKCGAWVATTCSTRNIEFVNQFGPDKIINYKEAKWELDAELRDLDAVIDCIGEQDGFSKTTGNGVVKPVGGVFVSIAKYEVGFDPTAHAPLSFAAMHVLFQDTRTQDELAAQLTKKVIKVPIDKRYTFTEQSVRDMLAYQASGVSTGKNVLLFPQTTAESK